MPEIVADPPDPPCYSPVPGSGIAQFQSLGPDPFSPRARDARGRLARGHSGNPGGRPPGIRNPTRRVPDLRARPVSPASLAALIDRKRWLLRPLLGQILPPRAALDPAEQLGINLASVRNVEDFRRVLSRLLTAISRGEIGAGEAARIARRARARLRAARRLSRLARRQGHNPAHKTAPLAPPIG
jgi:hypothetical protein